MYECLDRILCDKQQLPNQVQALCGVLERGKHLRDCQPPQADGPDSDQRLPDKYVSRTWFPSAQPDHIWVMCACKHTIE